MTKSVYKQSFQKFTEINILLKSYHNIFSEFDPNSYAERTLSDDFITQAKNISENKKGNKMLLKLLLPANMRNAQEEKVIVNRLYSHFKSIHQQLNRSVKNKNINGLLLALVGISLLIAASYLSFTKPEKYYLHLMLVLFEPAGWFMLWVGLDHLVYASKNTKKELAFYSKMIKSEIMFISHQSGN